MFKWVSKPFIVISRRKAFLHSYIKIRIKWSSLKMNPTLAIYSLNKNYKDAPVDDEGEGEKEKKKNK